MLRGSMVKPIRTNFARGEIASRPPLSVGADHGDADRGSIIRSATGPSAGSCFRLMPWRNRCHCPRSSCPASMAAPSLRRGSGPTRCRWRRFPLRRALGRAVGVLDRAIAGRVFRREHERAWPSPFTAGALLAATSPVRLSRTARLCAAIRRLVRGGAPLPRFNASLPIRVGNPRAGRLRRKAISKSR